MERFGLFSNVWNINRSQIVARNSQNLSISTEAMNKKVNTAKNPNTTLLVPNKIMNSVLVLIFLAGTIMPQTFLNCNDNSLNPRPDDKEGK